MTIEFDAGERWSAERAAAWANAQTCRCGCNVLPSSVVSFLEMWHGLSFNPATIERDLGWAAGIGLNAVRTSLPFVVWRHDRAGLLARNEQFFGITDALGIATVLGLFDDCGCGGEDAVFGPQPDPIPGVHNGRAVASPGRVCDATMSAAFTGASCVAGRRRTCPGPKRCSLAAAMTV
jgi:hypothetical protein